MKPKKRYLGITERDRTLLFLLREVPFVTLRDIKAFLYPDHQTISYTKDKTGFLIKEGFVTKSFLENGKCIYFLTQAGLETCTYFFRDEPKFDPETLSFYFRKPSAKTSGERPFFLFPAREIEFRPFTPEKNSSFQFYHSKALLELYHQLQRTRRFSTILWLDKVKNKKETLDISCNPDFLLTNSLRTTEGRVLIELENSQIREHNLVPKLDNLCQQQADYFLMLCTHEDIFRNLGLKIRTVLAGKVKANQEKAVFRAQTLSMLSQSVWIGLWKPSLHNAGQSVKLKTLTLYRYDHEIFDSYGWVDAYSEGRPLVDSRSGKTRRVQQKIPYSGRRPGRQELAFSELLSQYTEAFKTSLNPIFAAGESVRVG